MLAVNLLIRILGVTPPPLNKPTLVGSRVVSACRRSLTKYKRFNMLGAQIGLLIKKNKTTRLPFLRGLKATGGSRHNFWPVWGTIFFKTHFLEPA